MIVKKLTPFMFDVFNPEKDGWDGWMRVRLDHKARKAVQVRGTVVPEELMLEVVNTHILPQIHAEWEANEAIDKARNAMKRTLRERVTYPYKDHYVTNQE